MTSLKLAVSLLPVTVFRFSMVGTWLSVLQQKPYSVSLKPPLVLTVAEGVGGKSRNGAHAACQLRNLQLFGCESDGLSISGSRLVDGESSDDVLGFGLQVGNLDTESFGFQADGRVLSDVVGSRIPS